MYRVPFSVRTARAECPMGSGVMVRRPAVATSCQLVVRGADKLAACRYEITAPQTVDNPHSLLDHEYLARSSSRDVLTRNNPMSPIIRRVWTAVFALLFVAPAAADPPARVDLYGDPLPPGAVARLGTVRFRHGSYVSSMAISADGKHLAVAGGGNDFVVWDLATGARLHLLKGHTQSVQCVAFSLNGTTLASAGYDGIRLWDAATYKERRVIATGGSHSRSLAISADGTLVAGTMDNRSVFVWETATGKRRHLLDSGITGYNAPVAYSPAGNYLATCSQDG